MPKIVDHDERRATISTAAADLIAEVGIEATTMKKIGTRAGRTTGAVTHYFADKDDVVLAALLLADGSIQRRFTAALTTTPNLVEALLAALPNDVESRRDWRVWRVFSDYATRSDSLLMQYQASSASWLDTATEMVASHAGCSFDQARLDAEMLVAVVDAIGDEASVDPDSWPPERQRELLEHCFAKIGRAT
jgi:AcrR family transcriptional regulator